MNFKIRKKLHKIIDLSIDAKDLGHDCFFDYQCHVNRFYLRCFQDGWKSDKKDRNEVLNKDVRLDEPQAEVELDEIIAFLENLIEKNW